MFVSIITEMKRKRDTNESRWQIEALFRTFAYLLCDSKVTKWIAYTQASTSSKTPLTSLIPRSTIADVHVQWYKTGYPTPTQRFSRCTTQASPSWCTCILVSQEILPLGNFAAAAIFPRIYGRNLIREKNRIKVEIPSRLVFIHILQQLALQGLVEPLI